LRSVWERRGELALLRALGYRNSAIGWLIVAENGFLIAVGLVLGTVAALLSVLPRLHDTAGSVSVGRLMAFLGVVLLAGVLAGVAGALCIILSLKYGGTPLYVAPLVFAGAPIVNAVVSLLWKTKAMPDYRFFVGLLLAAVGAGLVLYSKADLDAELRRAKQARQ